MQNSTRIIAIDPGYDRLGIAIIDKMKGSKESYVYSECFQTPKTLSHAHRLASIAKRMREIIAIYKPERLAIETLFLANNQKTAMYVAEARGVVITECALSNMEVFEYSPPQIKLAVCGDGRADKKSIMRMVPMLLKIPNTVKIDDEFDAIAIGLTCFAIEK